MIFETNCFPPPHGVCLIFNPNDILHFFGDDMHPEGNDYPLKKEIIDNDLGFCYNVKDYKETWKILKDEFSI